MSRWLARRLKRSPAALSTKQAAALDRLQRACARQVVDHGAAGEGGSYLAARSPVPTDAPLHQPALNSRPTRDLAASGDAVEEVHEPTRAAAWRERILGWFKAAAAPAQPDDRRVACRHAIGGSRSALAMFVGPSRWPAAVTNISATGAAMILGMRQPLGSVLQLVLANGAQGVQCPLKAQVMRIDLRSDGRWLVGCAFDRTLDEKYLQTLLAA